MPKQPVSMKSGHSTSASATSAKTERDMERVCVTPTVSRPRIESGEICIHGFGWHALCNDLAPDPRLERQCGRKRAHEHDVCRFGTTGLTRNAARANAYGVERVELRIDVCGHLSVADGNAHGCDDLIIDKELPAIDGKELTSA